MHYRSPFWNEETEYERNLRVAEQRERAALCVCTAEEAEGLGAEPEPPKPEPLLVLPPILRPISDEERAALSPEERLERMAAAHQLFSQTCAKNARLHPWKSQ